MPRLLLVLATLSTGLFAGLCFCYAFVVTKALARLDDVQYVVLMRQLNDAVPGPAFFTVFLGAPLWSALALAFGPGPLGHRWPTGAALSCCVLAAVITVTGNVPLNARLAAADTSTPAEAGRARAAFERRWNRLHALRTAALTAALALLACAPR